MKKLIKQGSFVFSLLLAIAAPCFADDSPMPGPALEQRQKLFDRIQQAKTQGIGITGYLQAFKALEDQVKAGDAADKITTRVEQINKAVSDQLERAKILKTQKPLPPQGSQVSGGGPIAAGTKEGGDKAAAGDKGDKGDALSRLKDKFGDKIPEGLKEKLMSDPRIIEKLKERAGEK